MILRFDADGRFGPSGTTRAFAKHYSGGGVLSHPLQQAALDSAELDGQGRRSTPPAAPVSASPKVLTAILDAAMRYAGHPALRETGLGATDWVLLFQSNIEIESAYNPRALSHAGAIGLGQLMPDTARALGVDPHDMDQNLDGSARYLLKRLAQFGTPELALAAYNAGAAAVIRHDGIPPYPETIGHVRKVMAAFHRLKGKTS
ncbi:lytic transglycosylase domain-containing protein [Roseinatronobacter alkalisoli]|uniref:Lytic transglycosylase domain-containing protein n=1 Tax=Roseinatronobacter alkalisoli TaxID=3028235 RepID=A0ABT5TA62_9RHOB|nr:lytic transglycosylase domain-containing protein [Roseinatronobacter sp. HJB301]MDD7972000.1 lytic transglycosylase domain-containing protein [Roseinatronobacter sp. HJB301]